VAGGDVGFFYEWNAEVKMELLSHEILERKIIIRITQDICDTSDELLSSPLFKLVLKNAIKELRRKNSILLSVFGKTVATQIKINDLIQTFIYLTKMKGSLVPKIIKGSEVFFKDKALFNEFVEYLYNYWRSFDRFIVCSSSKSAIDKKPYRTFNNTIEQLTHLIRAVYRDIQENITSKHPKVYRQVMAGAEVAAIAVPMEIPFQSKILKNINQIPVIRQVLLYPPLILEPPMNKRTGRFERVQTNPLERISIKNDDWLCYPAKVGKLVILIYFYKKFFELGFSLSNLFELADDSDLKKKPDAVYFYGVEKKDIARIGESSTIFYDDKKNDMLVAAVPNDDEFGYFGYLKKMVLTLHNIKMMKRGKFPFHGALVQVTLKGNKTRTILLIGDTAAGKSETLEAFRLLSGKYLQDLIIVADDMGTINIDKKGDIIGFGTEIGAFLRLDDLSPGYAFGQIDRAIIMSPNKVNARIVLPVTTFANVVAGHKIDFILYANNYEEIDDEHPIIDKISSAENALHIFREGMVMSKGTTTSTGIVHSYFANIFGPPQYHDLYEKLARKYFHAFYNNNIFVGQLRTRLGLTGYEQHGPEEAAKKLLDIIQKS